VPRLSRDSLGTRTEEKLVRQMRERLRRLMWVRGHQGVRANEEADNRAKGEAWMGPRMHKPDIVTLAGIWQAFPLHTKAPKNLKWPRDAIRGLTYMLTDKGPQRWLAEIGRIEDPSCVCDGWTSQNAAHLFQCPWVGDGRGRCWEQAWGDAEWCAAVAFCHHYSQL